MSSRRPKTTAKRTLACVRLRFPQTPGIYAEAFAADRRSVESFGSPALRQNLLFYLATQPSQFAEVIERLHGAKLLHSKKGHGWQRLVVEKPFGHDLTSARSLNEELTRYAHEEQVCRIDHYLGKETVQNILMFRFSNSIFERLWNRDSIDHVQITVSEKLGVGGRGGYYEEAGALRDMVQNHMLQVLCVVAMEPPWSLGPDVVRARLAEVGRLTREALADVPGWEVVPVPDGAAGAAEITALRPVAGQKVAVVRSMLLAGHQIVTTAAVPARAPSEMKEPYLRISPHVDVTPEDLAMLRRALPAS